MSDTIRVVIADDSPFVRELLRNGLSQARDIEVVGEACDGRHAQVVVAELAPDVVTMDLVMPMVGGVQAIEAIMATCPTPIVVVADGQTHAPRVIEAGAVDVFPKPARGFDERATEALATVLRNAARARVASPARAARSLGITEACRDRVALALRGGGWVGVVASTGGPVAIRSILGHLPASFRAPIAVVQHTSHGFADAFARWLDANITPAVSLAIAGHRTARGQVVVAPDDAHLEIDSDGRALLTSGPPVQGHRPAGTTLLASLAASYGEAAVGIVCTGMGCDGADGLAAIERAGGVAMVQSPSKSALAGMPRAALASTRAADVGTAEEIGHCLRGARTWL